MKVVLLTNILSPYRKFFFDELNNQFKDSGIIFLVLVMATTEPDRKWTYYEFKGEYTKLLKHKTIKIGSSMVHVNFGLKKILKEYKPNILIASGSYTFPSVWQILNYKLPSLHSKIFWSESHLNEKRNYSFIKIKIREKIRYVFYNKFNSFWYSGKLSGDFIEFYNKSSEKSLLKVPNLVDENLFFKAYKLRNRKDELRKKYSIDNDKLIFVCPARLEKEKGIIPFLNILKLTNNHKNAQVIILGDGSLKKAIKAVSKKYKLNVKLEGYKNQEEMINFYALADFFLLPSLSDPNPLSCIEAIWAGLPLFISRHVGNSSEVIEVNKNGFIFDYENEEQSVSLIEKVIDSDEEWLRKASIKSLDIANKDFTTNKEVSKIVTHFKSSGVYNGIS